MRNNRFRVYDPYKFGGRISGLIGIIVTVAYASHPTVTKPATIYSWYSWYIGAIIGAAAYYCGKLFVAEFWERKS